MLMRSCVRGTLLTGAALMVLTIHLSSLYATNDYNFSQCVRNQNCANCRDSFTTATNPAYCGGTQLACLLVQAPTNQTTFTTCVDGQTSNQWCQVNSTTIARCNNENIWVCSCRDAKTGDCLNMPSTCTCSGTPTFTGWSTGVFNGCTGGQ
jgi:hypothetical protein